VELISTAGPSRSEIEHKFQTIEKKIVKEKGYGSRNYLYILRLLYDHYSPTHPEIKHSRRFEEICNSFARHVTVPPVLFPQVPVILENLSHKFKLYVLTKGNIEEQKKKLERSKLLPFFQGTFVENEKNTQTYKRILSENRWNVDEICMIGNSPKSDINPALKSGMYAVFIPYEHTWVFDDEPLIPNPTRLKVIHSFPELHHLFLKD